MVRHFVGLKARLTWNGVRHDRQRTFGFPIATTIQATLTAELVAGITVGEVYLFVILASVFQIYFTRVAASVALYSISQARLT